MNGHPWKVLVRPAGEINGRIWSSFGTQVAADRRADELRRRFPHYTVTVRGPR